MKPNVYVSENRTSAMIHAVEFARVGNEQLTFYKISSLSNTEAAKKWLVEKGLAEGFMGETILNNDVNLVVRTPLTQKAQLDRLKSEGIKLHHPIPDEKKVTLWGLRGGLSMVGQVLQLSSAYFKKPRPDGTSGIDRPTATFAVSNIIANLSNMVFGSQKESDPHRLAYIKSHINQSLGEEFAANNLPAINEKRSEKRPQTPKTIFQMLQKYSVTIGEVGLRMFGSFAMAFPVANWGAAAKEFGKGNISKGFRTAYNTKDAASGKVGIAYLVGKTIALFSKVPDPYNPNPKSTLDTIREKVLFKLSSIIEFGAAGYLSYDRYANKTLDGNKLRKFGLNWKAVEPKSGEAQKDGPRDYFGASGGALFTVGLGIRYFAPFGERMVDMVELKAHLSDSLAKVPQEKLPHAMAKMVADIVDHFGEKSKITFGSLYAEVATDLLQQHKIKVPTVPMNLPQEKPAIAASAQTVEKEKTFASADLRKSDNRPAPAASHQERASHGDQDLANTAIGMA